MPQFISTEKNTQYFYMPSLSFFINTNNYSTNGVEVNVYLSKIKALK